MALKRGTRLGPYQIECPIRAGGMGEVYKATDTRLERTVAIKVLPAHVASDPKRKARFEREAKTISSLNHPHICTLHDVPGRRCGLPGHGVPGGQDAPLGEGGMGAVYQAHDPTLQRTVAIKVLAKQDATARSDIWALANLACVRLDGCV